MNEKIKQIAIQSGYTPLQGFDFHNSLQETFLEKFAKLIISECIDIANEYDAPKLSGPGMIIGTKIEEHFGVENDFHQC
jgi:hypothetical protein